MAGFDTTYRKIADYPSGDAARAERAVAADGTEVIIKTVHPTDPGSFAAELSRVAATVDPHLERVISWEQRGDLVAIATEPVPGRDLASLTAGDQALPADQVVGYGVEAALGLAALHDRGLVHGGVKPSTLTHDPRAGTVLVDARLAQAAGGPDLSLSSPADAAGTSAPKRPWPVHSCRPPMCIRWALCCIAWPPAVRLSQVTMQKR